METDQELQAAQERLLEKRRQAGLTGTETHTPSMTSSLNEWLNRKCQHGNPLGNCPECRKAHEEWLESERRIEAEEREKIQREKAEREAEIMKERLEHPQKWLSAYGVPRKFINCSFDSFHGGEKIKAILRKFPEQSMLLYGTTGSGKTHLAVATLRELIQRDAVPKAEGIFNWSSSKTPKDAVFISTPDLLLSIRSSFSSNCDEKELVERYTKPSILILDDLGADKSTEWAITTLYLIIDNRNKELMPTIVTTNLSMQEIENQYGARIASRLSDMRIISISLPDYRKKRAS